MRRRLFIFATVALTLGCGSDALGPVTTVDGQWYGNENGYALSVTLAQTATGDVTGSALLAGNSGSTEATVSGTFVFPTLTLTISPQGFVPLTYTGTMSQTAARIDGRLNGSGFTDLVISISKRR
jgi:hypothetical protein